MATKIEAPPRPGGGESPVDAVFPARRWSPMPPGARSTAAPRARAAVAVPRPGLRRLGRLHRSRQLRHQHRRRRPVRLPAALGRPRGEPDRDGRADAVGEARDRDRQEPARALPRAVPRARPRSGSGSRPSSSRWRPTSPRSSAPRSALYLLFGIPLFWAGLIAGAGSFAILALQQRGVRKLEAVIVGFLGDRHRRRSSSR